MRQIISDERKSTRYLFLDVETGNLCLHESRNLPWQVSFISVVNNKIEEEFDFMLKWKPEELNMSRGAAEKNHYDPARVQREGIEPHELMPILRREIERADHVCGHNIIGLDAYLILALCAKLGEEPINILTKPLDTLSIAKGIRLENLPKDESDLIPWQFRMYHYYRKGFNKNKLEDLGKQYGIEHDYSTLHNSLSDLQLNIKVFNQQKHSFSYTG
jgi:DNA polymerase III epsilon subunit-like protein